MLLFKMAEIKMTKTEINKLIEALDLNGDGMIDFGYISFVCFLLFWCGFFFNLKTTMSACLTM